MLGEFKLITNYTFTKAMPIGICCESTEEFIRIFLCQSVFWIQARIWIYRFPLIILILNLPVGLVAGVPWIWIIVIDNWCWINNERIAKCSRSDDCSLTIWKIISPERQAWNCRIWKISFFINWDIAQLILCG